MIAVGVIENESDIRSAVLLHCQDELMEGSLVMWTLRSADIGRLFLRQKYEMNSREAAFSTMKAEFSKIGKMTMGIGFPEINFTFLVDKLQVIDRLCEKEAKTATQIAVKARTAFFKAVATMPIPSGRVVKATVMKMAIKSDILIQIGVKGRTTMSKGIKTRATMPRGPTIIEATII
jgi:hypothetical protein